MTNPPAFPHDAPHPAELAAPASSVCPQCGAPFRCGEVSGDSTCGCFSMPHGVPLPSASSTGPTTCLCPGCLQAAIKALQELQP